MRRKRHSSIVAGALRVWGFVGLFSALCVGADYTVHVLDPAITNHMILPDGPLPPVCKQAGTIKVRACRGEYESASFVVTPSAPLEGVRVEVGPLAGPGGEWPKDAIDVRVVKSVYRRVLGDVRAIVPTLLVHDEGFLGAAPAPTEKDPSAMKIVATGELRDAAELQPVTIDTRKQFWMTVHVPEDAAPGTFETALRIVPQNAEASKLTLEVEVYPFKLLPPMLEYSIYYPAYPESNFPPDHRYKFGDLTREQFAAELRNMLAHGVDNPNIYAAIGAKEDETLDFSRLERMLEVREGVGMRPRRLFLVGHPILFTDRPPTPQEKDRTHRHVRAINAWAAERGYDDVYFMANDEWWGEQLSRERDSIVAVNEAGGKVFTALMHNTFFDRVGDVLALPVLQAPTTSHVTFAAGKYSPAESLRYMDQIAKAANLEKLMCSNQGYRKAIDGVHRVGNRIYTYMNPMAGVPLPDLQRRCEGLGLWRVGFDGTMTWAYTHIIDDKVNQSLHFSMVYRTDDGVLDTLHWEGFREGVDEVG